LNDYIIHFDRINQPLESIQSLLNVDSVAPKERFNQSKGEGNQHKESTCNNKPKESTQINQHKESTETINIDKVCQMLKININEWNSISPGKKRQHLENYNHWENK
jgi:hypothetical protein